MAGIYENCYSCGSDCISTQFCLEDSPSLSLPKHLKVKIIANPSFWGFGDNNSNVLISGWASFSDGHYDFFDGYDESHFAYKSCGGTPSGPYRSEQRPDILYRSVYTGSGVLHYNEDGVIDNIDRGGAEVYLVNQGAGLAGATPTSDGSSCDDSNPLMTYKSFPENFGFGNKISFTNKVFKNSTGAWRLIDINTPNSGNIIYSKTISSICSSGNDGYYPSGSKQNITKGDRFLDNYDHFKIRSSGEYPICLPDGSVAGRYFGLINSIYKDSGTSPFCIASVSYHNGEALGIRAGSIISLNTSGIDRRFDGAYSVIDIVHNGSGTNVFLAGTYDVDNFNSEINSSGYWSIPNTFDPETCCSKNAYGIDNTTKKPLISREYHSDFGRIFNNAKNIIQSNRFPENRFFYDLDAVIPVVDSGSLRFDEYVSLDNSGIYDSGIKRYLPYYGEFYNTDLFDYVVRREDKKNSEFGQNYTCYTKKNTLSVFPSCTTQYYQYTKCGGGDSWSTNRVPRLSFVYRGANFYDNCKFDSSGLPFYGWGNSPSNIDQLRSGLAGLEMVMYLNMGDARGAMIVPPLQCSCDGSVPGNSPPSFDIIESPVSFASFPKFDLYPTDYGCQDPKWQKDNTCDYSGIPCGYLSYDYLCNVKQPYTTYGYIRSLCGQEDDDRIKIITEGFSSLIQDGNVRNTTPGSGVNKPVYWEFTNPYVLFSGSAQGEPPFLGSGNYPFWGVADDNGRLISPYFRAVQASGSYTVCDSVINFPYLKFDPCTTAKSGWPTENVPFLIEIDHDDSCVGCATVQMEDTSLSATLNGIETSYHYGVDGKYGFNYCLYNGLRDVPQGFSCVSGWPAPCDVYNSYPDFLLEAQGANIGDTCPYATGQSLILEPVKVRGSKMLLGYTTWNTHNSFVKLDGSTQSIDNNFLLSDGAINNGEPGIEFDTYISLKLTCYSSLINSLYKESPSGYIPDGTYESSNPLDEIFGSNGRCSRHYPSADTDLSLYPQFVLVPKQLSSLFEMAPEPLVNKYNSFSVSNLFNYIRYDFVNLLVNSKAFGCTVDLFEYGCATLDSYGGSTFYPCGPCTPSGTRSLCECGADCLCGEVVDYTSIDESWYGPCTCDCNLSLMRQTHYNESGYPTIVVNNIPSGCSGVAKAVMYSGDAAVSDLLFFGSSDYDKPGYGPEIAFAESACRWKSGSNNISSGINYYINPPENGDCGLEPKTCSQSECAIDSNVNAGLCSYPIPFDTGNYLLDGVNVVKKSCYPEVMIVSKIECISGIYNLHVAREYYNHDRTWRELKPVPDSDPPTTACYTSHYGAYIKDGVCQSIPYAAPADSVTPAWGTSCLVHHPTGIHSNQDFTFNSGTSPSGDMLWNYYNLFYGSGFFTGNGVYIGSLSIDEDNQPICESGNGSFFGPDIFGTGLFFNPIDTSGTLSVNSRHSCLQDQTECGGDLFCNKMFFPRRSYVSGTNISKFGSLQICSSNSERYMASWYTGYDDLGTTDLHLETRAAPFIDVCDPEITVQLLEDIGIDDTVIRVSDILPLMGINRSKFRYLSDIKSCVIVGTGCVPVDTHSNQSISAGVHSPKTFFNDNKTSFGYYLDKIASSGGSECLFAPFKILVDVDCCTSNIRRKNSNDNPTNLDYIIKGIGSPYCGGLIKTLPCGDCESTTCGGSTWRYDQPDSFACIELYPILWRVTGVASRVKKVSIGCLDLDPSDRVDAYLVDLSTGFIYPGDCQPVNDGIDHISSIDCLSSYPATSCCDLGSGPEPIAEPFTGSVFEINGVKYITTTPARTWTWQCDGIKYLSSENITLDPGEDCCFADKTSDAGWEESSRDSCCQDKTICKILSSSIALSNACKIFGGSHGTSEFLNYENSGVHLNPSCGCAPSMRYIECYQEPSYIHVNITEGN